MFPDAVPLGVRTPDGRTLLNPPDAYTLLEGELAPA